MDVLEWITKKTISFYLAIVLAVAISAAWIHCFLIIAPGTVGIKVNLLGDRGVNTETLSTGMHWVAPWVRVYKFPIFMQNDTWEGKNEEFNFQTSEGLSVFANLGISYHLERENIPHIFAEYRRGIDEITHIFLRNYIRDALNKTASKMKIEDLYSSEKQDFLEGVETHLKSILDKKGIIIDKLYLIGKFHLPETVVHALNLKIEAIQRAHQRENELKEAEAVARKQMALAQGEAKALLIKAQAEAESNKLVMESISEKLIMLQAVQKWNGQLPQIVAKDITGMFMPMQDKVSAN
jgi:regulator of protease activity HflC (stomatin/prohibitin superfamily)